MSWQEVTVGAHRLIHGPAEAVLPTLEDASVQLIVVDPPYFRHKLTYNGERLEWDRQWKTRDAYLSWLRGLAKEWQRILTPNGSLYCFASPQLAAWVEVTLSEVFNVLQQLVWRKHDGSGADTGGHSKVCKEDLRSYFPQTERIIFAEQAYADSLALQTSGYAAQCEQLHGFVFEPLRRYLEGERQRAGIGKAAINGACGFAPIAGAMASRHYFSPSQWCLPTQKHYLAMQHLFNAEGRTPAPAFEDYHPSGSAFRKFHPTPDEFLRADYEALRADYEALRADYEALRADYEALRRPFTVSADVPFTDVLDFATVPAGPGKHAAEKPLPLLRHLIMVSSRPGDTVLDCMMGSGSTLEAAQQCGRTGIGIEQDAAWWRASQARLSQLDLFAAFRSAV